MTPSALIIADATASRSITDSGGRRLTVRRLTALDKLRLFKAAGPVLSQNQPWLGMALIAYSVSAIDDVPVPMPINEAQIEATVARLGDVGVSAVAATLGSEANLHTSDTVATAGN